VPKQELENEKKYKNNKEEILKKKNKIETINNINIKNKEELKTYNNIVNKKKKIRNNDFLLCTFFSSVLLLCAITSFNLGTICSSVLLLSSIVFSLSRKTNIKKYKNKIKGLKYSLTISEQELNKELNKLKELEQQASLINLNMPHNEIMEINDKEELNRVERNIQLAYLYKIRENIIKTKIKEQSIDNYLNTIKFNNDKLNEEDKNIILNYANEKKKILQK